MVAEAADADAEAADTDAEAAEAAEAAGVAEAGVFRSEVSASAVPDFSPRFSRVGAHCPVQGCARPLWEALWESLRAKKNRPPSDIMSRRRGWNDILPRLALAQYPQLTTDKSANQQERTASHPSLQSHVS